MAAILNNSYVIDLVESAKTINPFDHSSWSWQQYAIFAAAVILGERLQEYAVPLIGWLSGLDRKEIALPPGGKMLAEFELIDHTYITLNTLYLPVFAYHVISWVGTSSAIVHGGLGAATLLNTVVGFIAMWIVYDAPYALFHYCMHHRSVYAYVHKHHHRQVVPFRGTRDGFNIHPIEMLGGSYCYLLSMFLVAHGIRYVTGGSDGLHWATAAAYMTISSVFSGLNHTRFDLRIPGVYQVAYHDVHHSHFTVNYGQYLMMYDKLFGTFRPHPLEGKGLGVEKLAAAVDDGEGKKKSKAQ